MEDLTNTFTRAEEGAGMCSQEQNKDRERGEKGVGGDHRFFCCSEVLHRAMVSGGTAPFSPPC